MKAAEETVVGGPEIWARRSRFRLEDFDTLEPAFCQWRVMELWPTCGVCFLVGPSMSGKSFWILDALANVRRAKPVLGRRSRPCGVLYVAAEAAPGVRKRIKGLRANIGPLGGGFGFIGQAPNLRDPDDVEDLRSKIHEAKHAHAERGIELGIVCIDTLSAATPGANENSSEDMSLVLTCLQELASELGVLVIVVAHTGKDESRGIRGWSGLLANADGLIMLDGPHGETRTGTVVKVKDGQCGDRFAFTLRQVNLGEDQDGELTTTCVVDALEVPCRTKAGRKPTLVDADVAILRIAFKICCKEAPAKHPRGQGAKKTDLRVAAFRRGLGPSEPPYEDLPEEERRTIKGRWLNSRNHAFDRAMKKLLASEWLEEDGIVCENVWSKTLAAKDREDK